GGGRRGGGRDGQEVRGRLRAGRGRVGAGVGRRASSGGERGRWGGGRAGGGRGGGGGGGGGGGAGGGGGIGSGRGGLRRGRGAAHGVPMIPGRHRRMGWSSIFDNSGGSLPPPGIEDGPAVVGTRRGEFGGLFGGVAGSLQRRLAPVPKALTPALSRG